MMRLQGTWVMHEPRSCCAQPCRIGALRGVGKWLSSIWNMCGTDGRELMWISTRRNVDNTS